jgi:hypothetical protein
MNKVIWKFAVPLSYATEMEMPSGAEILHVGLQKDEIFLWAKVDPNAEKVKREFMVEGTGQPPNRRLHDATHLGTVSQDVFVWHVFEVEGG